MQIHVSGATRHLLAAAGMAFLLAFVSLPALADEANGDTASPVVETAATATAPDAEPAEQSFGDSDEPLWLAKPSSWCEQRTEREKIYYLYFDIFAGDLIPDCQAFCDDQCLGDGGRVIIASNDPRAGVCRCYCCLPK